MKKLLTAATFVAMSCGLAMAQGGPNPAGMDAPGAISPTQGKAMKSSDVKMKKKKMTKSMKGNAQGPQTGTAKDTGGSAPAR